MSKTVQLSADCSVIERTFRVERETPRDGNYSLRIHRQRITTLPDGSEVHEQIIDAYNEPAAKTASRAATAAYILAVRAATSPSALILAEAAWYDALVDEVRVEAAAAAAAAKV